LRENLADFAERINNDARLVQMISDWDRVILVRPTDGAPAETLVVSGGRVRLEDATPPPSIVLEAPASVLADIFSGRSTPTEPYLDGTLRVLGSQEDVIRLDFLSLMIWGA
jgi:putative sterol carrier protein